MRNKHSPPVPATQHTQSVSFDSTSTNDAPILVSPTTPPLRAISPSQLAAPLAPHSRHSDHVHQLPASTQPQTQNKTKKPKTAPRKSKATVNQGSRFPSKTTHGERQCTNCGEVDTPQWRGTLCNACALWKRSRGTDRPLPLLFPRRRTPTPTPALSPSPNPDPSSRLSLSPSPPLLDQTSMTTVGNGLGDGQGHRTVGEEREEEGIEGLLALGGGAGAGFGAGTRNSTTAQPIGPQDQRHLGQPGKRTGYWQRKKTECTPTSTPEQIHQGCRPTRSGVGGNSYAPQRPLVNGDDWIPSQFAPSGGGAAAADRDLVRGRIIDRLDVGRGHRATSLQPRSRSRPPSIDTMPQLSIRLPLAGTSFQKTHHSQTPITERKEGVHSTPVSPINRHPHNFPQSQDMSPALAPRVHGLHSSHDTPMAISAQAHTRSSVSPIEAEAEEAGLSANKQMNQQVALSNTIAALMAETREREARRSSPGMVQAQTPNQHYRRNTISIGSPSTATVAESEYMTTRLIQDPSASMGTDIQMEEKDMSDDGASQSQQQVDPLSIFHDLTQGSISTSGRTNQIGMPTLETAGARKGRAGLAGAEEKREKRSPYLPYSLDKRPRYKSSLSHHDHHDHQTRTSDLRLEALIASQRGTNQHPINETTDLSYGRSGVSFPQCPGAVAVVNGATNTDHGCVLNNHGGGGSEGPGADAQRGGEEGGREKDKDRFMRSAGWLFDILDSAAQALRLDESLGALDNIANEGVPAFARSENQLIIEDVAARPKFEATHSLTQEPTEGTEQRDEKIEEEGDNASSQKNKNEGEDELMDEPDLTKERD
ncbi:hypothetical protein IAU59_004493 [Kwoniella sp. CBS 9459]